MLDFSSSYISHLQILTQEDWNAVLYNGMASTTPLAALYFVALMTFGNYVLFNLLVAILVEGFQAEVRAKAQLCLSYFENVGERMRLIELCCAGDTKAAYKRIISSILPVWFLPSLLYPLLFFSFFHSYPPFVYLSLFFLSFFHADTLTHTILSRVGMCLISPAIHSW